MGISIPPIDSAIEPKQIGAIKIYFANLSTCN